MMEYIIFFTVVETDEAFYRRLKAKNRWSAVKKVIKDHKKQTLDISLVETVN